MAKSDERAAPVGRDQTDDPLALRAPIPADVPAPAVAPPVLTPDTLAAALRGLVTPTPEPAQALDQTVPGGRYQVNGVWVDAHGNRLKDQTD